MSLKYLYLFFLVFFFALSLTKLYHIDITNTRNLFVNALLANTLFSILILGYLHISKRKWLDLFNIKDRSYYYAAFVIFSLTCFLLILGALKGIEIKGLPMGQLLLMVSIVPFFEEIVFRVGFGSYFRKIGGFLGGAYFSALLFAYAHSMPTIEGLQAGIINIPLGPFLLGLICEYLFFTSKSILPGVSFHIACNTTAVLFYQKEWFAYYKWFLLLYD